MRCLCFTTWWCCVTWPTCVWWTRMWWRVLKLCTGEYISQPPTPPPLPFFPFQIYVYSCCELNGPVDRIADQPPPATVIDLMVSCQGLEKTVDCLGKWGLDGDGVTERFECGRESRRRAVCCLTVFRGICFTCMSQYMLITLRASLSGQPFKPVLCPGKTCFALIQPSFLTGCWKPLIYLSSSVSCARHFWNWCDIYKMAKVVHSNQSVILTGHIHGWL